MFGQRRDRSIVSIKAAKKGREDLPPTPTLPQADGGSELQSPSSTAPEYPVQQERASRRDIAAPKIEKQNPVEYALAMLQEMPDRARVTRKELASRVGAWVDEANPDIDPHDRRNAITETLNSFLELIKNEQLIQVAPVREPVVSTSSKASIEQAKEEVQPEILKRIDISKATDMSRADLAEQLGEVVSQILVERKIQLNLLEQRDLVTALMNDMLGLGPLEILLADEKVTDIMVNGPKQVYVERGGKLQLSDVIFRDNAHLLNICQRIVAKVGRRVDESTPLCDCRLEDGLWVNIVIPPLAIDGPSISIRKFSKMAITLDKMVETQNISEAMCRVLKIAARSRLNILISGGTGSGKTTLLNALSQMIDVGERIVTIEDAAELQLQQPHVVRLETRPPNLEGQGTITQTDLVKNALRMRPDRIILGEIRGGEAMDMLQAMNTGHDGSLGTVHANRPREALTRMENMVAMSGVKLPVDAVRTQIAGALDMIVQIARMRDGIRRVTHVTEVIGMEGEIITTQDLFKFEFEGEDANGKLFGRFQSTGLRPAFMERAEYFGLGRALMEAINAN